MSTLVTQSVKILAEITRAADENMVGLDKRTPAAWEAERAAMINHLVQIYSAHKIADAVAAADSTLERIDDSIGRLGPA